MRKIFLFLLVITGFLLATNTAHAAADNVYKCRWTIVSGRGVCQVTTQSCYTNFKENCAQFTTQSSCNNNSQGAGNNCVVNATQPPPGQGCAIGTCSRSTDCGGGLRCLGADTGVQCSGKCECAENKCNGNLDCNSASTCSNVTQGQWCSGSCIVPETPSDTTQTGFSGYCTGGRSIKTAIGCIPVGNLNDLASFFLRWGLGLSGGFAIMALIYSSFLIMTSAGDPKRLDSGKEMLFSAVSGIILMTFCVFVLRIIGVNVLGIF